jgi:NAD dependent epimerase/dehydratase family enzyme
MSWIDIDDLCHAIGHIIQEQSLQGAVNIVSPEPVRNKKFVTTLGHVIERPTFLPMPSLALRLLLGEMADALLLSSTRAVPQKLLDSGFTFNHSDLYGALQQNT